MFPVQRWGGGWDANSMFGYENAVQKRCDLLDRQLRQEYRQAINILVFNTCFFPQHH
jgi:hypothetical protein